MKGEGNQQDYGMRVYDGRVGRFLSVDPLTKQYPHYTPYSFAGNKPIVFIDRDGEEEGLDITMRGVEKAYLNNKISGEEARQQIHAISTGGVIGTAVVVDAFLLRGKASQSIAYMQFAGAFEHNRAKTPEGRAEQDQRSKDIIAGAFLGWMTGKALGVGVSVIRAAVTEVRALYNFGSKALGEMGEEALARGFSTIKPEGKGSSMFTSLGARKPDGIPAGTTVSTADHLYEAKVGFQNYSGNIVNQVEKDAELLSQGTLKNVTWVFYRSPSTGMIGASDELLNKLKAAGINTRIAGDIPEDIVDKAVIKYGATKK